MDGLIKGTELGVPERSQFGVFLPQGQPLGEAFFKFGDGPGAEGIGADFVDHRPILQVTGVGEVTCRRTDGAYYPIAAGIKSNSTLSPTDVGGELGGCRLVPRERERIALKSPVQQFIE
jgi:hypothetical protein